MAGKSSFRPRLAVLSVSVFLALSPVASHAGLKEALNEMFVSTSTNPQAIDTQRLMGVYGGSMTLRPVGKGINIMQLAAPRIDAGCGGIDIFFGSFSFINGEQFEQLLRSLASAAVGYAIKAAIQAMCDPCAGILAELEAAIRELNALAKNTCAIANAMFQDNGFEKLTERARKIGTHLSNAAQKTADWAAGESKSQGEKASETAKGPDPKDNPAVGNLVWKAAKETLNNGGNTLQSFLSEKEVIELVMGLYGTVIVLPEAEEKSNQQQVCTQGVPDERCDIPAQISGPTIATWDQLFRPRQHDQEGVKVWVCGGQTCTQPIPGKIPLSTWGGVQDAVNIALFGVAEPLDPGSYTPDSIVGSFTSGGGTGSLSPRAKGLVQMAPVPILRLMLEVQHVPGGPELLGHQLAAVLPDLLAYNMGVEFLTIGRNVFTNQTKVTAPAEFNELLKEKARQLIAHRPDGEKVSRMLRDMTDSVIAMQSLTKSNLNSGSFQ